MIASLSSGLSTLALALFIIVIAGVVLIFYALRTKGDVSAELSHGRTIFKIDARDRRSKK
jgi:hypothetical protein